VASGVASATYTVKVPDPSVDVASGTYAAGQKVIITNLMPGAAVHYTIDGQDPTTSDPAIPSGSSITLLASLTLKAKGFKTGCVPSDLVQRDYTVTGTITPRVISAGNSHSLAVQSNNSGWAWGLNGNGRLGDGTTTQRNSPLAVSALASIVDTDGGESHTVSLKTDGTAVASGINNEGQLGKGSISSQETFPVPVLVELPDVPLTGITQVAAGGFHSLALTNGTLYSFGRGTEGQLGTGSTANQPTAMEVTGVSGVTAIDAGRHHSIVLTSLKRVWTFGKNDVGQLGRGPGPNDPNPGEVTIPGNLDVIAIAAGQDHNLAVTSDKRLWSWGRNNNKQLGDGTTTHRDTPVPVETQSGAQSTGMTKVLAIGAGNLHSFAVRADGSLWGFGSNSSNQLTNGVTPFTEFAQLIPGIAGVVSATGGSGHSVAVTAAGELYGWGLNANGQVGMGTEETPQPQPVPISMANLNWRVAKPVMSVLSGTYNTTKTVTISTETNGATVLYGINGDPTETVPPGGVQVDQSLTLKARAVKVGMPDSLPAEEIYTLKPNTPTFTVPTGTHANNFTVGISVPQPPLGVAIQYTLNGGAPIPYMVPFQITKTTDLQAIASVTGWTRTPAMQATP
jgi:alpha-tubulin suppressor-like RCC1 family protein